MTAPTPYLCLPGTARAALEFYADVFGGEAVVHDLAEFGRTDGPPEAVAHGYVEGGPVTVFASDAVGDDGAFRSDGLMLALLGTADSATLHRWFDALAEGGRVVDALQQRPWGASDGQVVDRFGLHWLVGYEPA
ncbi:VOC family protein [Nocardioides perillae]|uniref:PhnB protein n=1 Tax=Nocardioides perillae TaxID=1119534 RepID=A0A7Y9RTP5_9ACTN|nr:PhnB protein [Nocardioides perillae]